MSAQGWCRLGCVGWLTEDWKNGYGQRRNDCALLICESARKQTARREVRIAQSRPHVLHDRAAAVGGVEDGYPFGGCTAGDDRGDPRGGGGLIPFIIDKFGFEPNRLREGEPEFLFQRCSGYNCAVTRVIKVIARRTAGHEVAALVGPGIRSQSVTDRPIHEGEQIVSHGDIEKRAFARNFALAQREHYVHHCRVSAASNVADERGRHDSMPGRAAGDSEQSAIAEIVQVVTCTITAGTILAVAGDAAVDELTIELAQCLVVEAQPFHDARPKLFDNH